MVPYPRQGTITQYPITASIPLGAQTRTDETLTPVVTFDPINKDGGMPQSPSAMEGEEISETHPASPEGPSEANLSRTQMHGQVVSP